MKYCSGCSDILLQATAICEKTRFYNTQYFTLKSMN